MASAAGHGVAVDRYCSRAVAGSGGDCHLGDRVVHASSVRGDRAGKLRAQRARTDRQAGKVGVVGEGSTCKGNDVGLGRRVLGSNYYRDGVGLARNQAGDDVASAAGHGVVVDCYCGRAVAGSGGDCHLGDRVIHAGRVRDVRAGKRRAQRARTDRQAAKVGVVGERCGKHTDYQQSPIVTGLKDTLAGGSHVDAVLGLSRDAGCHVELISSDYLKVVLVQAVYNYVCRGVVFERLVLCRYSPDHTWYASVCYGVRIQRHVPVPEVLIKGGGETKHVGHAGDRRDIPVVEGLVEGGGACEHGGHVVDRGYIPVVEGLVEGGGACEHGGHVVDRGYIPVVVGLVEGGGAPEHAVHTTDRGDVPVVEGLVEGGGAPEHAVHTTDRGDVPVVEGLVEGGGAPEHRVHVGDRGDVPAGDVAVEGRGAPEHLVHVGDCGEVWRVGCVVGHVVGTPKGFIHGGPCGVPPLIQRDQFGRVGGIVQVEPCQVAGYLNGIVACSIIGVDRLGAERRWRCCRRPS